MASEVVNNNIDDSENTKEEIPTIDPIKEENEGINIIKPHQPKLSTKTKGTNTEGINEPRTEGEGPKTKGKKKT